MAEHSPKSAPGRYAYAGLERIMHEKARLGILTTLLAHAADVRFGDLKELCALTDGNLSRHLQALEEAGLVVVTKSFRGRRPETRCRLSASGRRRFRAYLEELQRVLEDAAGGEVEDAEAGVVRGTRGRAAPATTG